MRSSAGLHNFPAPDDFKMYITTMTAINYLHIMAMFDLHLALAVMILLEILKFSIKSLNLIKTSQTDLVKRRFVELLFKLEIESTIEKIQ